MNEEFKKKYPTVATMFWDVIVDRLTDRQIIDLINLRYDNLVFWDLTDIEWDYMLELEKSTGIPLFFLTEKKFYKAGFFKKFYPIYKNHWNEIYNPENFDPILATKLFGPKAQQNNAIDKYSKSSVDNIDKRKSKVKTDND